MRQLRKNLQCKNFSWYLQEVYPESLITKITDITAMDRVRNSGSSVCLQAAYAADSQMLAAAECYQEQVGESFLFHRNGELRPLSNLELCVVDTLETVNCERTLQGHRWEYTEKKQLRNLHTGLCLTLEGLSLSMSPCLGKTENKDSQSWELPPYNV